MTLTTYQKAVDDWIVNIGVRYFSPLTNMAILAEEVGEVGRYIARIHGDQSFKEGEDENNALEKLADELSDVIWVVTCLANQHGFQLEDMLKKNMDKKTKRDSGRHLSNIKLKNNNED